MNQTIKKRIEEIKSGIVPEGYEKTSFGIFPCDWEKKKLQQICDIFSGGTPSTNIPKYWDGNIAWCVPTDITRNKKYIDSTEKYISQEGLENSSAKIMPVNSILMCSRATIGPRCINRVPMATNQGFKNLVCKKGYYYEFIYYYIEILLNHLLKKSNGSTFLELSKSELDKSECVIPQLKQEQSRIAEILMQWDKAIELQEKYIKQLEFRKKAIMQKLLTPKDEWDKKSLYNICKIETGKLDVNAMVEDGEYPFFTCSKQVYRIDQYAYECEALLMAGNGDIGDIKYYNGKFNAYQRTYVLYDFSCDIKYVMYFLQQNFDRAVMRGTQRSSMPFIKLELLKEAIIKIPKNKDFVVKILSQADIEISLQAQKLNKLLKQRKAMQQYLLTGIVRV